MQGVVPNSMGQRSWIIVWRCQMRIRRSLLKFPDWFQRCRASGPGVILECGLSGTVSSKQKRTAMDPISHSFAPELTYMHLI